MAAERERGLHEKESSYSKRGTQGQPPFAYVTGVWISRSLKGELRGRLWFNHLGRSSLSPFAMPLFKGALDGEETGRPFFNRHLDEL